MHPQQLVLTVPVGAYATLDEAGYAAQVLTEVGFNIAEIGVYGTNFDNPNAVGHSFWQRPFCRGAIASLGGGVIGLLFGFLNLFNVVSGVIFTLFYGGVVGAVTGLLGYVVARATTRV